MTEYIDRNALIEHIRKDPLFELVEQYGITGVIESFPVADVQPVTWIPVTERLPEEKGNYLVVQDCGHGAEVHEAFFFKYFDSWEWYDPVEEYQKYNPSHWMPLPKPPKEE